jgi:1,4-alpha-glucan branching enzyme
MKQPCSRNPAAALALLSILCLCSIQADDIAQQSARAAPVWLRDGVIYELFPRNFSAEGNFNGITARLDELHDLGVTIIWLMPIHPLGQKLRKGTIGSPYAVRDYYAINPDYGTEAGILQAGCQWQNHSAGAGMDRCRRFELQQSQAA